jgi:hypothetical protein
LKKSLENRSGRLLTSYVFLVIGFFIILAAFSLSTPLFSSADEPAQVIYAAAAVRGELHNQPTYGPLYPKGLKSTPYVRVMVPQDYAVSIVAPLCYVKDPRRSASCMPDFFKFPTKTVSSETYVGRYIPTYYLIVGLVSLIYPNATGVYLMRLISDLLNALFLALGFYVMLRFKGSKNVLLAMAAAVTPACFYWASMVNPNGLEITAAFSSWVIGAVLITENDLSNIKKLTNLLLLSLAALSTIRALSPLWALIILVCVVVFKHRQLLNISLFKDLKVALGVFILALIYAIIWDLTAGSLIFQNPYVVLTPYYRANFFERFWLSTKNTIAYYNQDIAVFDWNDYEAPRWVSLVWTGFIVGVLAWAFKLQSKFERLVGLVLVVLSFLIPVFFNALEGQKFGPWWQGRYGLPYCIGVVIFYAVFVDRYKFKKFNITHFINRYLFEVGFVILSLLVIFCLYWDVRRNAVGTNGPLNIFFNTPWHGPLDNMFVFLPVFGFGLILLTFRFYFERS